MAIHTFKKGGIHPDDSKYSKDSPIVELALPRSVTLLLSQHIGVAAVASVKVGDAVVRGQKIAEPAGYVSAAVHSPISGKVKKIEPVRDAQGRWQPAVIIETEPDADPRDGEIFSRRSFEETEALSPAEIIDIVRQSGIVGLGGAAFPTNVKITVPEGKKADILIINGAECEPYLTCDHRIMTECPADILQGIQLLARATGAEKAVVGIEDNKPDAIRSMTEAATQSKGVEVKVMPLRKKYPQGGEKQLIAALTGREVPPGALPIDVGAVVDNVATALAVCEAVCLGKPLLDRVVTVSGNTVERPGNYRVAVGASVADILNHAGLLDATAKIISGGPMMGRAVSWPDSPVTKGLSGLLAFDASMASRRASSPCIRCGRCVEVCPMGLEPFLLARLAELKQWEQTRSLDAASCLECGCCSYSCPSARPLLDYIKLARINLRKKQA